MIREEERSKKKEKRERKKTNATTSKRMVLVDSNPEGFLPPAPFLFFLLFFENTSLLTLPKGPNVLSEVEAQKRASIVSNVSYTLDFKLQKKSATYESNVVIHFSLSNPKEGTFLDFVGHQIHKLVLNGKDLTGEKGIFTSNRLCLPAAELKEENELQVTYVNKFDHTGAGFHQFIDPEDQEVKRNSPRTTLFFFPLKLNLALSGVFVHQL
jgi:hypothetical protein